MESNDSKMSTMSSESSGLEDTNLQKSFGPFETPEGMILLDMFQKYQLTYILATATYAESSGSDIHRQFITII